MSENVPVAKGWTLVTGIEELGWVEALIWISDVSSKAGLTMLLSGAVLALGESRGLTLSVFVVSIAGMSSSVTETTSILSETMCSAVPYKKARILKTDSSCMSVLYIPLFSKI